MRHPSLILSIIAILFLSTLAATINFSNYLFINVSSYFELAFGVSIFVVLIISVFYILRKQYSLQIRFNLTDLLVLILAVYLLVSYILSTRYNFMPDNAIVWFILFCTYFLIRKTFGKKNWRKVINIYYIIVIIGSLEAVHGLLQIVGLLPIFSLSSLEVLSETQEILLTWML